MKRMRERGNMPVKIVRMSSRHACTKAKKLLKALKVYPYVFPSRPIPIGLKSITRWRREKWKSIFGKLKV